MNKTQTDTHWKKIFDEWEEIECETPDHLMTVLDVFAHDSADGHMTPESFEKAVNYIKQWVMYRSQFTRNLANYLQEK